LHAVESGFADRHRYPIVVAVMTCIVGLLFLHDNNIESD